MSGAGARTLTCHGRLWAATGVPVVSSDLGPYRALAKTMDLDTALAASWRPTSGVGW